MSTKARSSSPSEDKRSLVFEGMNRESSSSAVVMFQLISVPAIVACVLSAVVSPTAGLVGLIGSGGFMIWRTKRGARERRMLWVADGQLIVSGGPSRQNARIALSDLVNVELDIKTIERVQEGGSAIPAVRFINSTVAPPVDTARIVLVRRDGSQVRLSEQYLAHMDASEWLGKIRVFLRKNDWLPKDERSPESQARIDGDGDGEDDELEDSVREDQYVK